jgi:hypothetical protein
MWHGIRLGEMVRHALRLMLRACKHQARRRLGLAEQGGEQRGFEVRCHGVQRVRDRRQRDRVVNLYGDRRAQDVLGQVPDRLRHGGGEQQRLSLRRHVPHNSTDIGEKAHIEEAVGLVEDQHFEMGQIDCPLTQVVEEAARARNRNVDPGLQLLHLRLHAHATVEGDRAQGGVLSQSLGDRIELLGKFARRGKDQGTYMTLRALHETLQDWQHEGGGFAGAGLRQPQHVAALQHRWHSLELDRRRYRVAQCLHPRHNARMQMKRGKTHGESS